MWILNVGLVGHDNDLDKLILGSNQGEDPIRPLLRWTRGLRTGCHWFSVIRITLVPEKSVQYVAQFLASADLNCACARFCYSVSPWVTFQKFWNIKWIKICVYCYFNIFMLRRRILQRKRKFRRPLSSMCCGTIPMSVEYPPIPITWLWCQYPD